MLRIPYETVPLTDDFTIRKEDYFRENGGIIFPNPNAPTGVELGMQDVEAIIKANPDVIVVVDEAYVDFGAASALPLIEKYDNLLVVQTFSKSRGMAGMRIGYAMGNSVLIKYLNDVKYSSIPIPWIRPLWRSGQLRSLTGHILRKQCIKWWRPESGPRRN